MLEYRARVSSKGQVTIPADVRSQLGIKDGDILRITVVDRSATFVRETSSAASVRGMIPTPIHLRGKDLDQIINEAYADHYNEPSLHGRDAEE